jgi:tetratricopeptide (TPR) repeat protein
LGAAAAGVAGLAAFSVVERAYERQAARAAALRARNEVLEPLVADPPNRGSVFDVLLATSTEAAPFRGRRAELAWLGEWWDDPQAPTIVVVTGPGGIGKTRLVTEFAQVRPAPWVTGWLAHGRGADAMAAVQACGDPALILVDDADQRPDLAGLLASMKAGQGTRSMTRVILISRAAELVNRLARVLDDRSRGMLDGVREFRLGPFGSADDRARWFAEAVRAYARARQTPPPDLPGHLNGYVTDPAEPILTLQAQALLAVLDSEESRPMRPRAERLPFDQVTAALFAHERHRWQASAQQPGFALTDLTGPVQSHAIAALLLASPADQPQAVVVLRHVPELHNATDERLASIAGWAVHLYSGDPPWPIQIKPGMLAEWFVVTQVTQTPDLAGLLRVMSLAQQAALLVLLAHASDHMPHAGQLFADIVATDTTRLAEPAVVAALTAFTGRRRLDGALADLITQVRWSSHALGRVEAQLTERLPRTQAAVAEARVQIARAGGEDADVATALRGLTSSLAALGRSEDALEAAQEAVDLWRPIAVGDPSHLADLAVAVGNLVARLGDLGRDQEALDAAEEDIRLWRPLAADDPSHRADLAMAAINLGNHLAALKRYQEALEAVKDAVNLCRPLIGEDPSHRAYLAKALELLGSCLGKLGRREEALKAAEEALDLWRPIAADDHSHQPDLARSLDSLGNRLADLGRGQEALDAAKEAVDLWRPIAADNPIHQPNLARSVYNFGFRLAEPGRLQEALEAAQEAVRLWRSLAADNPIHQPNLATSVDYLGVRLAVLGRDQEALGATEEAVHLWRQLARDNPIHQPNLAMAVGNLVPRLAVLGRHEDALQAAEEAVDLWRPIAADDPSHQPDLARVVGNLGTCLGELGRDQEALDAAKEAVDLWRPLAHSDSDRYQEIYQRTLAQLRRDLELLGQESASVQLHLDDDDPGQDKAHHIPPRT